MLAFILLIVLICVAAGIIGFVIKGLLWLFAIAVIVFIITVFAGFFGAGSRRERRRAERKGSARDKTNDTEE